MWGGVICIIKNYFRIFVADSIKKMRTTRSFFALYESLEKAQIVSY